MKYVLLIIPTTPSIPTIAYLLFLDFKLKFEFNITFEYYIINMSYLGLYIILILVHNFIHF